MPVFEYQCIQGHITQRLSSRAYASIKCESCSRRAKRIISAFGWGFRKGQSPIDREGQRRIRAHQDTDEFKAKVKSGELLPESELKTGHFDPAVDME